MATTVEMRSVADVGSLLDVLLECYHVPVIRPHGD